MITNNEPNLNIVKDGLICWYDAIFQTSYSGSGTTIYDISGDENDGTLINGVGYSSANGGALDFDGNNDYVRITSNGLGTFNLQEYSLDFWFNFDVIKNYNGLFSYDFTSHTNPYYAIHLRSGVTGLISYIWNINGSTFTGINTPTNSAVANNWYNVCVTYKSGLQQIYLNGVLENQSTVTQPVVYYNQEVWIGRANPSNAYLNGKVSTFKFYNKELSTEEIQHNYKVQKTRYAI